MSKSNFLENAILNLIFRAVAIANIADNAAASPLTNLYWSLHTADPGEAGTQATSETSYGSYARQPVARTTGGMSHFCPLSHWRPLDSNTLLLPSLRTIRVLPLRTTW